MPQKSDPADMPPFSEPATVPVIYASIFHIDGTEHVVRITCIDSIESGVFGSENRIVSRLVMTTDRARVLLRELRKALSTGAH